MSLLDVVMEPFTIMNRITVNDKYGGTSTKYIDGAVIDGVAVKGNAISNIVAQASGLSVTYNFTTRKKYTLNFHDVIKRNRDGKIFRVTGNSDDTTPPKISKLDMRATTLEEWSIPANE